MTDQGKDNIFTKGKAKKMQFEKKIKNSLEDLGLTIFYLAYGSPFQFTSKEDNRRCRTSVDTFSTPFDVRSLQAMQDTIEAMPT